MKYQEFEKGLKGKFQNASEHVDMEALFLNIHTAKPKKERKIFLWLFLSTCILTLGYSGVNYFNAPENGKDRKDSVILTVENEISEPASQKMEATTEVIINDTKVQKEHNSQPKAISSVPIKTQRSSQNRNVDFTPSSKNKKQISSEITVNNSNEIQKIEASDENLDKIKALPKYPSDDVTTQTINPGKKSYTPLQLLPMNANEVLHNKIISPDFVICPSFKKPRWALDIIPELGIIRPFKNLSNNGVETNPIFTMRSEDENTLEAIQAGLYLRARAIQKPIYFKIGASYTRISERMKLNTTWIERDTTVGILSITQSQNGDTITTILGDIITETEHFRTSSDHYYLHLIDLPISLGYNKSLGSSWRLGAEAGVQVNLSVQSSGKLLEGSGSESYTKLPADGRFRARLGLSYFGGITLEKTLAPRTAVYFTTRIRYFNSKFTPESYNIDQNYFFAGLHTGFVYTIR